MNETQFIKQLLDFCKINKLLFYRTQAGMIKTERGHVMKMGQAGNSDLVGCLNGKFIAVECKVGKNKQQPSQIEFEKKVLESGGQYWLVYSLEDFIQKLNKINGTKNTKITVC